MTCPCTERLDRLERQNRKLRSTLLVGFLGFLSLWVVGMGQGVKSEVNEVRARRFVLVDSEGRVRGQWQVVDDEQPTFQMQDAREGRIEIASRKGVARLEIQAAESIYGGVRLEARPQRSTLDVIGTAEHGRERSRVSISAVNTLPGLTLRNSTGTNSRLGLAELRFESQEAGEPTRFGPPAR